MTPLALRTVVRAIGGRPLASLPRGQVRGVTTDSRGAGPGDLFVALRGPRHDGHTFVAQALARGALAAVVSDLSGVDTAVRDRVILVPDTVLALGRLGAFNRKRLAGCVIAVTGSNGKTTTKAMIHHVLSGAKRGRAARRSYNNHIGVPLTLLSAETRDDFLVAELGSSGPGEIEYLAELAQPDVAVVTSVGLAHLAGLGDITGVAREKISLLQHLRSDGLSVINIDEPATQAELASVAPAAVVTFGRHDDADLWVAKVRPVDCGVQFLINGRLPVTLGVLGEHNAVNALGAYAVARHLGLEHDLIVERLGSFRLPDMRLQLSRVGDMLVINDSYNANPGSMRAALEALGSMAVDGRRVTVLGDMRELGAAAERLHREIGRLIATGNTDVLVGVGTQARYLCDEARRLRPQGLEVCSVANVEDLTHQLPHILRSRDTVLLKGSRAVGLERVLEHWPSDDPQKDQTARRAVPSL